MRARHPARSIDDKELVNGCRLHPSANCAPADARDEVTFAHRLPGSAMRS
jgi:hypothetical protein